MKNNFLSIVLLFLFACVQAQFAPPAGYAGTTAIYKDSACLLAWATSATIERGWVNILDTTLGKTTVGDASSVLGKAGENGVMSLGDAGVVTLNFDYPIYNGPGYDFAVFENSFRDDFLEFAFVEVSSDGSHFRRFPATSLIDTSVQVDSFGLIDCRQVHNLAGKYRALFGTPFDLNDLAIFSDIDIMHITQVRLIDVVGSVDPLYATRDNAGRMINDPFPTPYPSSGFDLDAVGIIHALGYTRIEDVTSNAIKVFPMLLQEEKKIQLTGMQSVNTIRILDIQGRLVPYTLVGETIELEDSIEAGIYFLQIEKNNNRYTFKITVME
ncbi:MAG: T9SS type A sorting domain-containing protein [Bacteroidota bacterium]